MPFGVEPASWPFLHPARSVAVLARAADGAAEVDRAGEPLRLGLLGEIHPLVADEWGLGRTAVFAVDLGKLARAAPAVPGFRAFGAYPPVRQDIAVVLGEEVSARRAAGARP